MHRRIYKLLESALRDVDYKLSILEAAESEPMDVPQDDPFHQGKAGEGKAENHGTAESDLESFLMNIADEIIMKFDLGEDIAVQHVLDCASLAASEGKLPPLPSASAPDTDIYMWIGRASTGQFGKYCADKAVEDDLQPDEETNGIMKSGQVMGIPGLGEEYQLF